MESYKRLVLEEGYRVGIWGLGYIGLSSAAYFAQRGVNCVGVDVIQSRVDSVNAGEHYMPGMDYWLGFDIKPMAEEGLIRATTEWRDLINPEILVHLIGVPTERNNEPFDDFLEDVIDKIANISVLDLEQPPLVIVESTLTPNTTENVIIERLRAAGVTVGVDVLLGVAPRRDWFLDSDKNLPNLPRVYGGCDGRTANHMADVLGIVCHNLHRAQDHRHAEIVKSVENAYRHVEISLANQLALAYPSLDMVEILELVGTKWNVGTFRPGIGTGGYCIPLSSKYVLQGAERPEALTLLKETVATDDRMPHHVAGRFGKWECKSVGSLGISYKGGIKVPRVSRSVEIGRWLADAGVAVGVNDPYFNAAEIGSLYDLPSFDFPDDLDRFDGLLLAAAHHDYTKVQWARLFPRMKGCQVIVDNCSGWADVDFGRHGISYVKPGGQHWLRTPVSTESLINGDYASA